MNNIVFENRNILIINKQIGELSQNDKSDDSSLISEIKKLHKDAELINRLDRGVGGLVLIGKNKKAVAKLSELQQEKQIIKKYIGVVCGSAKDNCRLEDHLQKNQRLNISKVVQKNNYTKIAILKYTKLGEKNVDNNVFSKIEIELFTGRHHQIRVQMANAGLPLYGDTKYNKKQRFKSTDNIGLFAYYTEFADPFTNELIKVEIQPYNVQPFSMF